MHSTCISLQKLLGRGDASAALFGSQDWNAYAIHCFKDVLGDPLGDQLGGRRVLAKLIDGQNTVAHHLGLGGGEGREHQTGTIAQNKTVVEVQGLVVSQAKGLAT